MKKLLALSFALFLVASSCSVPDDSPNYNFEILPVESVEIPDEFKLGETYPITVSYFRPSTCYSFKEFYYLKENNERTVAPINYVFEKNTCETLDTVLVESSFNFIVTSNGSYIFKFWQGKDENDEDQFLIKEIQVVE